MLSLRPTRRVATFAVIAGLLAVAAPAGASAANDNEKGSAGSRHDTGVVLMADMGGQLSRTSPPADGIIAVLIGL